LEKANEAVINTQLRCLLEVGIKQCTIVTI